MGLVVPQVLRGNVEPHEGLARAGYARDEDDGLLPLLAAAGDDLLHALCGRVEIAGAGSRARNGLHRVPRVQCLGGFDDRGARTIRRPAPRIGIHRCRWGERYGRTYRVANGGRVGLDRRIHPVRMRALPRIVGRHAIRRAEHREDGQCSARLVKVLEVEGVVPRLVVVALGIATLADLELDRHDGRVGNHHAVDTTPESRYIELEEQRSVDTRESALEHAHLLLPRLGLRPVDGQAAPAGEVAQYRRVVGCEEVCNGCRVERRLARIVIGRRHREELHASTSTVKYSRALVGWALVRGSGADREKHGIY